MDLFDESFYFLSCRLEWIPLKINVFISELSLKMDLKIEKIYFTLCFIFLIRFKS